MIVFARGSMMRGSPEERTIARRQGSDAPPLFVMFGFTLRVTGYYNSFGGQPDFRRCVRLGSGM